MLLLVLAVVAGLTWSLREYETESGSSFIKLDSFKILAQRAFEEGRYEDSERLLRLHLKDGGEDFDALVLLSRIYASTRRPSVAGEILLGLVRRRDGDAAAWVAFEEIARSLSDDPTNGAAHKSLAICLIRRGDSLGSLHAARKALSVDPADPELAMVFNQAVESAALQAGRPGIPVPKTQSRRVR